LPVDFINGEPPDASVPEWIRFSIQGDRDRMLPIVWISTMNFPKEFPEFVVVLKSQEYAALSQFVRSNRCHVEQTLPIPRMLQSTEYSQGKTEILCRFTPHGACIYLERILLLPEISWPLNSSEPIRKQAAELGCLLAQE